jgi:hydroxyethylthiazole kinase-like uncharacterized protein yjeF
MPSIPLLRVPRLREIEARYADADPPLMERAGAAAAAIARQMVPTGASVLIVAGPGNNGGDAFVVARRLLESGHSPQVLFVGDAARLPADALSALNAWRTAGGQLLDELPAQTPALVIDGLFGIGLSRPLEGALAALIERINTLDCPILALDVPSGIDATSGRVMGAAIRADRTLSFIAHPPGLLTLDGPDHCGELLLDDLGLGPIPADGRLIAVADFAAHLQARPRNSHKGSYGNAGIVGGASGMTGAALLAGRAALHLGAGRVLVGLLERLAVDPGQPELMLPAAESVIAEASALAVGPGLGQSPRALQLLRLCLDKPVPLLLDADALNLVATHPVMQRKIARRTAPTVLTPHPAEAARLLGVTTTTIQSDRVDSALQLALRYNADIVLKGCGSIVAGADGAWAINASGNPGLASGGSGDVLAGMVLALLAQGWPARAALEAGVHLHGAAADALAEQGDGPIGLTASELPASARRLINRWIAAA